MPDLDPNVATAVAYLRGHLEGEFQFDEHLRPLKIVVGSDGRVVAPTMVAMHEAAETVLFLPQAEENAMQLLVTVEPFKEEGENAAYADRWRIYHGEEEDLYWAFLTLDAVKWEGRVYDGRALLQPNPFAAEEARFCKMMNQQTALVASLCANGADVVVEEPLLVGVDPRGCDVRGRFEVIRVPFHPPVESIDEATTRVTAIAQGTAADDASAAEPASSGPAGDDAASD